MQSILVELDLFLLVQDPLLLEQRVHACFRSPYFVVFEDSHWFVLNWSIIIEAIQSIKVELIELVKLKAQDEIAALEVLVQDCLLGYFLPSYFPSKDTSK